MTPFDKLVRRTIRQWQAWRREQHLCRSVPGYAALRDAEKAARSAHKPVKGIRKQMQEALHAELLREVRHG